MRLLPLAVAFLLPACLTFTLPTGGDDDDVSADDDSTAADDDSVPTDDDSSVDPVDGDGDGAPAETDCDDDDPFRFPDAPEACNGVDDDCDAVIDDGLANVHFDLDYDGDGFGHLDPSLGVDACAPPEGYTGTEGDCADNEAAIHPGAPELCDGLDNDCDGQPDEGVQVPLYQDNDSDGYGSGSAVAVGCPGQWTSTNNLDCDDGNAVATPADGDGDGYSGCDGDCNDLDPALNPELDADGDGYTPCSTFGYLDCDDLDPSFYPGVDQDGDGATSCMDGVAPWDCDDQDPLRNAAVSDVCDGRDNDCDGWVDDDAIPIAVIHGANGMAGTSVLNQLSGDGYCTSYIDVAAVATTDLSWFRLVVLTHDTGNLDGWFGDPTPLISAAGSCYTSVVAMGSGGAGFLHDWGLAGFGSNQVTATYGGNVYAADSWSSEWNWPNPVLSPGDIGPVTIHSQANPPMLVATASSLSAQVVGWSNATASEAVITREWPCASVTWWGWDLSFNAQTQVGNGLFVNLVQYVVGPPPSTP